MIIVAVYNNLPINSDSVMDVYLTILAFLLLTLNKLSCVS